MSEEQGDTARQAAERVLELAAELEASGEATLEADKVAKMREALHAWVDTVTAVVAIPAFGRVALIHDNGKQSTINSADLAYSISK